MKDEKIVANNEIRASRVVVIDDSGKKLGEFTRNDAIAMAREQDMDLVQMDSSLAPICKIMDLGKFLYQKKKKAKASKANSTVVRVKELEFYPVCELHDLQIKANRAKKFIEEGDKVKVAILLRSKKHGRFNKDVVLERYNEFISLVESFSALEAPPTIAGNTYSFTLISK